MTKLSDESIEKALVFLNKLSSELGNFSEVLEYGTEESRYERRENARLKHGNITLSIYISEDKT